MMDNYEYYDTVMNIIEAILVEVDQYAKGLKKVTDEEIMLTYVRLKKDKDMDLEKVMLLDSDARAAYIETVSKKLGFIANVMEVEEIDSEELDEEEVGETKSEEGLFNASNMNLGEPEEPVMPTLEIDNITSEGQEELRIAEPIKLNK